MYSLIVPVYKNEGSLPALVAVVAEIDRGNRWALGSRIRGGW